MLHNLDKFAQVFSIAEVFCFALTSAIVFSALENFLSEIKRMSYTSNISKGAIFNFILNSVYISIYCY